MTRPSPNSKPPKPNKAPSSLASVVVAAGGSGGHIFPAEAFVAALKSRYRCSVILITSRKSVPLAGALTRVVTHKIHAAGVSGKSFWRICGAVVQLALGFVQSLYWLLRIRPRLVVGFGSYVAVPVLLAAHVVQVRTVLHEQNAVLGRANRLLLPGAELIALSFQNTAAIDKQARTPQTAWTGNPVRAAFRRVASSSYPEIGGCFRLLVLGGSQGAEVFGKVVPQALGMLEGTVRKRLRVVQQVRAEQYREVRRFYKDSGIQAETQTFFKNLARLMASSHLLICRAGAATLAELAIIGRPAILVPYPYATDDHQRENALRFVRAGAGWMIPESSLSPQLLMQKITSLLQHADFLKVAARCANNMAQNNAEEKLAKIVYELLDDKKPA